MEEEIIRRRYRFYGQVQGVGFRYRARYAAQLLGVTGWAENEWDGTVTMEAQGTEAQLDRMVPTITAGSRWIEIQRTEVTRIPVKKGEYGFGTRG